MFSPIYLNSSRTQKITQRPAFGRGFIFLPCGAKDTTTQQTTKTKAVTFLKRPTNNTTNTKTKN